MKRLNKTMRGKLQRRQRSRRLSKHRRQTRRQRGGDLPVPPGALVAVSTPGEYGVPLLMEKKKYENEIKRGINSLED